MMFGERVRCTGYLVTSHNHYEIGQQTATAGDIPCCSYWANGATEGVGVEDFHTCDRYRTVDADFSGIFVGETTRCTKICVEYTKNPYGKDYFRTYCDCPAKFAVVFYANNKKRVVPLDRIEAEVTE